ncbi:MAG: hypothetical protein ABSG43_26890 [Solirubrobacteraceae bacterium]
MAARSGTTLAPAPERVWLSPTIDASAGRLFELADAGGGWW